MGELCKSGANTKVIRDCAREAGILGLNVWIIVHVRAWDSAANRGFPPPVGFAPAKPVRFLDKLRHLWHVRFIIALGLAILIRYEVGHGLTWLDVMCRL